MHISDTTEYLRQDVSMLNTRKFMLIKHLKCERQGSTLKNPRQRGNTFQFKATLTIRFVRGPLKMSFSLLPLLGIFATVRCS